MGIMRDRLDNMVVRVASPDKQIIATLSNRDQVDVEFRPGAYRRYVDGSLEHQLARLASGVFVGYRRGYFQALGEATGEAIRGDETEHDEARRRFQEARRKVVACGASMGQWLNIETRGMASWRVSMRDGTVATLSQEQFLLELNGCVQDLLIDYYEKLIRLKDEFFGLSLPSRQDDRLRARSLGSKERGKG